MQRVHFPADNALSVFGIVGLGILHSGFKSLTASIRGIKFQLLLTDVLEYVILPRYCTLIFIVLIVQFNVQLNPAIFVLL